jgi:hypothetical protein
MTAGRGIVSGRAGMFCGMGQGTLQTTARRADLHPSPTRPVAALPLA